MEEVALFRDRVWGGGGDTGRVHSNGYTLASGSVLKLFKIAMTCGRWRKRVTLSVAQVLTFVWFLLRVSAAPLQERREISTP